jgi:hypothetical protein
MAIHQLTKCVPPGGEGNPYLESIASGLAGGSIWALIAFLMGASLSGLIAGVVCAMAYSAIAAFCDHFFNTRLICVQDSDVLIGTFWELDEAWDGDYCLNILPAPFSWKGNGSTLTEMQDPSNPKAFQRRFLVLPAKLTGYNFKPDHVHVDNKNQTPLVHTEIEGTKIKAWCSAMKVTLATLTVVTTIVAGGCAMFGPLWWLCVLIVLAIAALISYIVNEIARAAGDMGSLADVGVDKDAITIDAKKHPFIAIEGRLIFDAGHLHDPAYYAGWLELHAVRKIMIIKDPDDPDDPEQLTKERADEIIKKIKEASYVSETGAWSKKFVTTHSQLG